MNNKLIIAGIAVIILVGGVYAVTRTKNAEAPSVLPINTEVAGNPEITGEGSEVVTPEGASPEQPTPTPTTATQKPAVPRSPLPYTATVIYDGEEFIPEEITVIEGGKVTFVNQSDKNMWIATDNHPTHDRYPIKSETSCSGNAFDQCTSVTRGGSWSFTFARTSTWGYHNHMGAKATGKVIVKTAEEYLEDLTKEKPEWR